MTAVQNARQNKIIPHLHAIISNLFLLIFMTVNVGDTYYTKVICFCYTWTMKKSPLLWLSRTGIPIPNYDNQSFLILVSVHSPLLCDCRRNSRKCLASQCLSFFLGFRLCKCISIPFRMTLT